jgi:hypothetical protein
MKDIEIYNKYLDKKPFTIENPMGPHLPGLPAKIKMKIVGTNNYLTGGKETEYLTYKMTVLPTGRLNSLINSLMGGKTHKVVTTSTSDFYPLRVESMIQLIDFLSLMGEERPVMCIGIENVYNDEINENIKEILTEDVYDNITNKIVHDIIYLVKYQRSGDFELPSDINGGEFYQFDAISDDFIIELFLRESDDVDTFDADANYYRDDDVIQIMIVTNPDSKNTILQDLVYELNELVRHELEHVKQHESGYEFPKNPKSSHKYYGQSHELEALRAGFKKKAKKERKDLESVVRDWFKKNQHKYTMKPKQTENIINKILGKN